MSLFRVMAVAATIVLLCSATADAQNLLTNPDFTTDISGWTSSGTGTAAFDGSLGSPAVGSVQIVADYSGGRVTQTLSQCVPIAGASYDFIARSRTAGATGSSTFEIRATFYGVAACGGASLGTSSALTPTFVGSGWFEHVLAGAPLPGGTASALVELFADSGLTPGSLAQFNFDSLRFGLAGTVPVQLQTFTVD